MRLALRALGILERVNEPLFMSNLEIYDRKRPPCKDLLLKFMTGICSAFCDNSLPVQNIPRRIHMGEQIYRVLCSDPVNQTRPQADSGRVISGK